MSPLKQQYHQRNLDSEWFRLKSTVAFGGFFFFLTEWAFNVSIDIKIVMYVGILFLSRAVCPLRVTILWISHFVKRSYKHFNLYNFVKLLFCHIPPAFLEFDGLKLLTPPPNSHPTSPTSPHFPLSLILSCQFFWK